MGSIFELAQSSILMKAIQVGPKIHGVTLGPEALQTELDCDVITFNEPEKQRYVPLSIRPKRATILVDKPPVLTNPSKSNAQISKQNMLEANKIARKLEDESNLKEKAIVREISRLYQSCSKNTFMIKEIEFLATSEKTTAVEESNEEEHKDKSEALMLGYRNLCGKLINLQKEHRAEYLKLIEIRKLCVDKVKLDAAMKSTLKKLHSFESLIERAKKGELDMADIETAESIVKEIHGVHALMIAESERISNEALEMRKREEARKKEEHLRVEVEEKRKNEERINNEVLAKEKKKLEIEKNRALENEKRPDGAENVDTQKYKISNEVLEMQKREEARKKEECLRAEVEEKRNNEERINNEVLAKEKKKLEIDKNTALENEKGPDGAENVDTQKYKNLVPKNEKLSPEKHINQSAETTNNEPSKTLSILSGYFDHESFLQFSTLRQHLEDVESSLEVFMADPKLKGLRFSLQKAVTMPVNAISSVNAEHMKDKYRRLHNLLSGKSVECAGNKVNASEHPLGIIFVKNLLAKTFVSQGYKALSGKADTVFAVASVLVNLWVDFPDFGELTVAHFHRNCPYLAPVFFPRQEGQSDVEYYLSLGYKAIDGIMEKEDSFLNRMTGVVRLYAAVLISGPRGGKRHPLGMAEAWRWLAAILNLPPRSYVCPALILEFLKVTGHNLWLTYRGQFKKMLAYICQEYFPPLEKLTDSNFSGPLARLETFLQKVVREEKIPPHPDRLPVNFW